MPFLVLLPLIESSHHMAEPVAAVVVVSLECSWTDPACVCLTGLFTWVPVVSKIIDSGHDAFQIFLCLMTRPCDVKTVTLSLCVFMGACAFIFRLCVLNHRPFLCIVAPASLSIHCCTTCCASLSHCWHCAAGACLVLVTPLLTLACVVLDHAHD